MAEIRRTHILELRGGVGTPDSIALESGRDMGPMSAGTEGDWRLAGEGIRDVHAFLYFDGERLFVQSADRRDPAKIDRIAVGEAWTEAHAPCTIVIGAASIVFRSLTDVFDDTTDVDHKPAGPREARSVPPRPFAPGAFARGGDDESTRLSPMAPAPKGPRVAPLPAAGRPTSDRAPPSGDATRVDRKLPERTPTNVSPPSDNHPTRINVPAFDPRKQQPQTITPPRALAAIPKAPPVAATPKAPPVAATPKAPPVAATPTAPPVAATPTAPPVAATPKAPAPEPRPPPPAHEGTTPLPAVMIAPRMTPTAPVAPAIVPPVTAPAPRVPAPIDVPPAAPLPLAPPSGGIGAAWRSASTPKKILVLLLPLALASVFVIFRDEPAPRSPTARPSATAPSASTIPTGPPLASSVPPAPSAVTSAATPVLDAALASDASTASSDAGKSALERAAVDAVAAGSYAEAIRHYDELAAANPDKPAYREAARILRAKLDSGAAP